MEDTNNLPNENEDNPEEEINEKLNEDGTMNIFDIDRVNPRPIVKEMEDSYLEYAMSVIVSRALPDVRDGLKPVHRRILYTMHTQGLKHNAKFRKCAKTVGEVLGNYHPHGDTAVYYSMVRLAQDFSMRYPLIKGQGNFGSIDGDNPAAMRYTESKMEKISDEMLADIEKETVLFMPNYDATTEEPRVLPTKIPNLLINGTMGIAVGMATNIPPHNLSEVIDALLALADDPELTIEDLMRYIKGPDFPTAGSVYNINVIKQAYATGRGSIKVRGKADIEETPSGKCRIVISEIPYQVNKSSLISKIAELHRDKKVVGIADIRDESSRVSARGFRIVIELKKDTYPKKILNQIYKLTPLQTSFGVNMIALVDGLQPKLLNLKSILEYFIKHRKEVITNRVKYDLKIARARAHILEGLKIALDNIDEVISTIRSSETKEDARTKLIDRFGLTEIQANAILQMRLQTLAGLERKKIEDELKEKILFIDECEAILADPQKVIDIMKEELESIKEKYGDERLTKVYTHELGKFNAKDTIPNEPMVIALTKNNYIKRLSPSHFKAQRRGGKGVIGMSTKEKDEIINILSTMNHNNILYFTNKGRVFKLPAYEVPQSSRQTKGQAIVNFLQLSDGEIVTAMLEVEKFVGKYLFMATKNGTVKKTSVKEFENVRKNGLISIRLRDNDELKWVKETTGEDEIVLVTNLGKCIRFNEKDVRSMGRFTTGVRGIRLKSKDEVVEMDVVSDPGNANLFVIMENGLGKSSPIKQYRYQARGGGGVKTANITNKTGNIVGAKVIYPDTNADLILVTTNGQTLRTTLDSIPSQSRATQGVIIMRLNGNDKIASISLIIMNQEEIEQKRIEKARAAQTSIDL